MKRTNKDFQLGIYGRRLKSAFFVFLIFIFCVLFLGILVYFFVSFEDDSSPPRGVEYISWVAYLTVKMLFADADFEYPIHPVLQIARILAPALLPFFGLLAFISSL